MSLLDLPEGELAAVVSAACRTARYDEYLALTESAMEDYEDLADACTRLADGTAQKRQTVALRDEAMDQAALYAGVAAAYRPVVDVDRLVERVVDRLAELVRLVPAEVPRVLPVTVPKTAATASDRGVSYDPNPTIFASDRTAAYGQYARDLDDACPDWWQDDLTVMAPELAAAARMRRAMRRPSGEDGDQ